MALTTLLLCAISLASLSYGWPEPLNSHNSSDLLSTCNQIAGAISGASQVFFPSSPDYLNDISHASLSSTEASACSVEPGSAEDVSKILCILGSSRTPFAVKGGGHATNPGFSSTRGVQITMSRFNETKVNHTSGTVDVGAGLTWDQVYATLGPTGVNVVGGRETGLGVAGLTLGGGFSFKSSQYGLVVDNVAGYELVLPNGTIKHVTSEDEDLWFGLRGGMNNFGIVTKFIYKSYPQGEIWGGVLYYPDDQLDAIKEAVVKFQQKNDTKAEVQVILSYSSSTGSSQFSVVVVFSYDAPTPSGVFEDFLAISPTMGNVSTTSFSGLLQSQASLVGTNGFRVFYECAPVTQYSPVVFDALANQIKLWGPQLNALDKNITLTTVLQIFDNGIFLHGSDSAYPPDRTHAVFPTFLSIEWTNSSLDETMASALRQISHTAHAAALADGQNVSHAAKYVNYALFGTPLEDMYGGGVERLREIKAAIDPNDVMGLAGGWKF